MQKTEQKTGTPTTPAAAPARQGFTRRIGATTYRVAVHFSQTSTETVNDKIIRMIKNETAGKAAGY